MRTLKTFLSSFFLLTFANTILVAQIPRKISFQGILTNAGGVAISDSACIMSFYLYDQKENGTALWSENQIVVVQNGLFSVELGRIQPLELPFDRPYWLAIRIGNGDELPSRLALASSPYSLRACLADSLGFEAVGNKQIRNGTVVRSINSLTDNITLAGGENISITQ